MKRNPVSWLTLAATLTVLLLNGCTTQVIVPREEMVPGVALSKSRVETADGFEYRFDQVHFRPDTLVGEYSVTVERESPANEIYYEDLVRTHAFALSHVRQVSISRKDPSKTFLYGAGIAAAGFFIRDLTTVDLPKKRSGGSQTKPDPR